MDRRSSERRFTKAAPGLAGRKREALWIAATLLAAVPLGPGRAVAQQGNLNGEVIEEGSQRPIDGAQVTLVGTGQTARTDQRGLFSLANVGLAPLTIQVKRLGYRPLTQTVRSGDGLVRLVLFQSAIALDELVVTGTPGATEARAVGNALTRTVVEDVLKTAPVVDVQQVLAARVPGVVIMPTQGVASGGAVTRVRGVSSLFLPNEPLIYVDGVRTDNNTRAGPYIRGGPGVSRINDLDPEEIESIEVIKGPAAGTLYGTEASRGVIQVLTRRGVEGPPRFGLTIRQGANWFRNPEGRLNWAFRRNASGGLDSLNLYQMEAEAGRRIFSTGRPQAYGLSLSGGTPVVRYYASAGFDRNQGVVPYDWRNRFSTRANLTVVPTAALTIETSLAFVRNRLRLGQMTSVGAEIGWDAMTQLTWGGFPYLNGPNRGFFRATPEEITAIESRSATDRVVGSAQVRHQPLRWFSHRLTLGTDVGDDVNSVLFPSDVTRPFEALSEGDKTVNRRRVAISSLDYVASVIAALGSSLKATTSVGAQYYDELNETLQAYGHGFPAGVEVVGGAATTTSTENVIQNKGAGVFVQEQIGWKNRRFLTAALRVDDHSAFGANFNFAAYPKVSFSWVLNEESFFRFRFLDALKLRAAFGMAGRQPDAFAAERSYQPVGGPGGTPILTPQNVGNPDLKPERGEELEVGFDASLWQGRVATTFTYYRQVTRDAIAPRVVAPSGGFTGTQLVNLGRVTNGGLEASLNARILSLRSFGWELGASFSTNHNRIASLGGLEPIQLDQTGVALTVGQFHVEGYPLGAYFLPLVVSASMGASGSVDTSTIRCASGPEPGAPPARCDDTRRQRLYAGNPTPTWEGSLRTSVTLLRNLRLSAMVDIRGGHSIWSQTATIAHRQEGNTRAMNQRTDSILLAYEVLGVRGVLGGAQRMGLLKGDFAKLREVSATYTLPMSWARAFGATSATFTLAGRNLAILWAAQEEVYGFKVLDPEMRNANDLSGNNNNLMPPFAQFMAALRVAF